MKKETVKRIKNLMSFDGDMCFWDCVFRDHPVWCRLYKIKMERIALMAGTKRVPECESDFGRKMSDD